VSVVADLYTDALPPWEDLMSLLRAALITWCQSTSMRNQDSSSHAGNGLVPVDTIVPVDNDALLACSVMWRRNG
jgi:hypothetical protein